MCWWQMDWAQVIRTGPKGCLPGCHRAQLFEYFSLEVARGWNGRLFGFVGVRLGTVLISDNSILGGLTYPLAG